MSKIVSTVTGTVWKTLVQEGQSVSLGDELLVMESMKMEIPQEATVSGVVKAILVSEGQAVDEGDPLMEIAASAS